MARVVATLLVLLSSLVTKHPKIRHFTGDAREINILVLVEKILGGPENNQLLNATWKRLGIDK